MVKPASKKRGKSSKKKKFRRAKTKKGGSAGKITKVRYESTKEIKVERALVDNFIALQKVMVNLSLKFDGLTAQISKLLELFEISAKAVAKKEAEHGSLRETKDMEKVSQKLDNLAQQAGLIGRGLALIHEVSEERFGSHTGNTPEIKPMSTQRPMAKRAQNLAMPSRVAPSSPHAQPGYQKSIADKNPQETFPVSGEQQRTQRKNTVNTNQNQNQ